MIYLRITLRKNLQDLNLENFKTFLQEYINQWRDISYSSVKTLNIVKMSVFPHSDL